MQPFGYKPNLAAFPQVGVRRNIDYVRRKNFGFAYGITSLDVASGDCSRVDRYCRTGGWLECILEAGGHAAGGCRGIEFYRTRGAARNLLLQRPDQPKQNTRTHSPAHPKVPLLINPKYA